LLNLAFADAADFWLACPYDTTTLGPDVIARAHHSHPVLVEDGAPRPSAAYLDGAAVAAPFAEPLPPPPPDATELAFDDETLRTVRDVVSRHAATAGLDAPRAGDLALAAHELATNSLRHGGGQGVLRIWEDPGAVVCEVHDSECIAHPMAGRERPGDQQFGGHGLWLINQLCDLVQIRAHDTGGVVRAHMGIH
jgi:anti-sigma regulatory factor (Ser/Thr protein kinase)